MEANPGGRLVRRRARRVVRGRISPVAVPSFFTLMNLLSGFFSIVQASHGNLAGAAWLVVLAAFFDLLDGMMARLAHADSPFGVELDSLSDVVSFGVAPSFLVYEFGLDRLGLPGAVVAALPALCGAVRLARFNTEVAPSGKKDHFVGLPIPAMAGAIVAFLLTFHDSAWFDGLERGQLSILLPLVVVLSGLMIAPVRFPALPTPNRANLRRYPARFGFFVLGIVLVLVLREYGLLIAAAVYLLIGVGKALVWVVRAATEGEPEAEEPEADEAPGVVESTTARSYAPPGFEADAPSYPPPSSPS